MMAWLRALADPRTPDLIRARDALSQLSYGPTEKVILAHGCFHFKKAGLRNAILLRLFLWLVEGEVGTEEDGRC